jgi:hypothetical protein
MNIYYELKLIAKIYKIDVRFYNKLKGASGYAMPWKNKIYVLKTSKSDTISIFFHELGHVVDFRNKKYIKYNGGKGNYNYLKKFSLLAERHADNTGKNLCKKYFPKIKWKDAYRTRNDIKFLNDFIKQYKY